MNNLKVREYGSRASIANALIASAMRAFFTGPAISYFQVGC